MNNYMFLTNSNKPMNGNSNTSSSKRLTNMSTSCLIPAMNLGYKLFMSANDPDKIYSDFPVTFFKSYIYRNPLNIIDNIKAYKSIMKVIRENGVDAIHCNTPIGGLLGRLCGHRAGVRKIIYTVHGFHFYKGAPKKNWLIYYPIEKWLARYTDALITITYEDYEFAKTMKLRPGGKVYHINGVGIDTEKIKSAVSKRTDVLKEIGANENSVLLISAGELNQNKNNIVIIDALGKLQNKNIHYILCGIGDKREFLSDKARSYGLENNIHFLGYRTDIGELLKSSDIFVMPSYREGLSRSIMEAMSAGLPCIVSEIRGNVDLIDNGKGGFLAKPADITEFAKAIKTLTENKSLRKQMGEYNLEAVKKCDIKNVKKEIEKIYNEILKK